MCGRDDVEVETGMWCIGSSGYQPRTYCIDVAACNWREIAPVLPGEMIDECVADAARATVWPMGGCSIASVRDEGQMMATENSRWRWCPHCAASTRHDTNSHNDGHWYVRCQTCGTERIHEDGVTE
jgi:hypothetical protein